MKICLLRRKTIVCALLAIVFCLLAFHIVWEKLPERYPSFAWKTKMPSLQEPAIQYLMKRLYIGMPYEEMVLIMGPPPGYSPYRDRDGVSFISYNVNFGFNRGIDISIKDGKIISIFEYD